MGSPLKHARNRKTNNRKNNEPRPGVYLSTLVEITPAPGYRDGDAYVFTYSLTDKNSGAQYVKKETFFNNAQNERFDNLITKIEAHGFVINDIDDFLGLHEEVVLMKEVNNNVPYLNVYDRTFIDFLPIEKEDD